MSTQRGGLVHTECGGSGGGIERVEGAVWLESTFGRRIAFFVTAETASTRRRKDLPDTSVCFRRGLPSVLLPSGPLSLPTASHIIGR